MTQELISPDGSKEEVLKELTEMWRYFENASGDETSENETTRERLLNRAYDMGASQYEILKSHFTAATQEARQSILEMYSFDNTDDVFESTEELLEYYSALQKLRDEFELKDAFRQFQVRRLVRTKNF